jgi:hypothetical protein
MQPLMAAWKAACGSAGAVTMLLSPGTYYIGPVQFHGPCNASTLTFQLQASPRSIHTPVALHICTPLHR